MFGRTFTDIATWVFYTFSGPVRAKAESINVLLWKIGQHVGDWEHVTLRVSNFNGELKRGYFSEHSGGTWVNSSEHEFKNGNKPVAYSSLHSHALYPKLGLVLQGSNGIGIRNDTAESNMVTDLEVGFEVVSAEYLGSEIMEPPWLEYFKDETHDIAEEPKKAEKLLPGKLKELLEKIVRSLPSEVWGEDALLVRRRRITGMENITELQIKDESSG